jgi:autotransporter-associated beta strand protein
MNRMVFVSVMFCAASLAISSSAETIIASDAILARLQATTNRVESSTQTQGAVYPVSVGEPAFWLDCSDTSGWGIRTDGTMGVTNVPSKAGSKLRGTRFLTPTPDGGDWTAWGTTTMLPPQLVTNAPALGGGSYLDFKANRYALSFNPAYLHAGDTAMTNALDNIGTVIAVWGSDVRNGGHFLGGGANLSYGWHRAGNPVTGTSTDHASYRWSNAIMNGNAQPAAKYGYMWQDGLICAPMMVSYNGGWQVISLQCTDAIAQANGIGINDKRSNMDWVSGGQEVAELLIYDTVLTREQIELVEMYLEAKWLERNRTGWNGEARLTTLNAPEDNFEGMIDVAAGDTLEIDRVIGGGQPSAKLIKTGAGALNFEGEGLANYAGELVLSDGSLSFPSLRATPTLAELPNHIYARFDPSERSSLDTVEGPNPGTNYVQVMRNLVTTDDAYAFNRRFMLRPRSTEYRPWILPDELGSGLDIVDFGAVANNGSNNGVQFVVSTNEVEESLNPPAAIYGIATVVGVIGAQRGGGNLLNNRAFSRASQGTASHQTALYYHSVSHPPLIYATEGKLWMNGSPWDAATGYATPGYQVAAFQTPGGTVSRMMIDQSGSYTGGGRIGEMLIWNRVLSEREVRDAQAYLYAKWFNKATPGYALPAGAFVATDIQRLTVPEGVRVEIAVGAGRTVRIGKLVAEGELVKTGAGALEIETTSFLNAGKITIAGGSAEVVGVRDVESATAYAPGATMHLDATDVKSLNMRVRTADNQMVIDNWYDKNRGVGLWRPSSDQSRSPRFVQDAIGAGLHVVDFGKFGSSSAYAPTFGGTWAYLDRPLHSMRSIYVVIGNQGGGGWLFGNRADGVVKDLDQIDFHSAFKEISPNKYLYSGDAGLFQGYPSQNVFSGNIYTNGVNFGSMNNPIATNCYFLLELHPSAGVSGGQVALDRFITDRIGGFSIGEMIVYERELSAREKIATRNYLMQKWFGAEPEELPAVPEKTEMVSHEILVEGDSAHSYAEDVDRVSLIGSGTFTKSGAGTLSLLDVSAFTGTVDIAQGTLKVKNADPYATPELVTDGIIYHADATYGITTTKYGTTNCVAEWASAVGDGMKAVRSGGEYTYMQRIVYDPDLGYRPTVDMQGYNACFVWQDAEGNAKRLSNIKSAFWMVGSQNGGGFLMGGGEWKQIDGDKVYTNLYAWHRGIYYPVPGQQTPNYVGTTNVCVLLHSGAQANARSADWWKNGESVGPTSEGLSGKWDQLSMVVKDDDSPVNADGLAYDGRSRKPTDATNHEYNGHQRLAELICYDRRLSDEERQKVECYLRCKWNNGMHAAAVNVVMNVAADATLDLDDNAQHFASITGAGTVANGTLSVGTLLADGSASAWPSVDGTFAIAAGQAVELANIGAPAALAGKTIKILSATSFTGAENLSSVVFTGAEWPAGVMPRLKVQGNDLAVVFTPLGTKLFLR